MRMIVNLKEKEGGNRSVDNTITLDTYLLGTKIYPNITLISFFIFTN